MQRKFTLALVLCLSLVACAEPSAPSQDTTNQNTTEPEQNPTTSEPEQPEEPEVPQQPSYEEIVQTVVKKVVKTIKSLLNWLFK